MSVLLEPASVLDEIVGHVVAELLKGNGMKTNSARSRECDDLNVLLSYTQH